MWQENSKTTGKEAEIQRFTYPLCVTSTCLSPSFLNMSMTVSIGVWSVTVMGARSRMRRSLTGEEADAFTCRPELKITSESSLMSSCLRRAFPVQRKVHFWINISHLKELQNKLYPKRAANLGAKRSRRGNATREKPQREKRCAWYCPRYFQPLQVSSSLESALSKERFLCNVNSTTS